MMTEDVPIPDGLDADLRELYRDYDNWDDRWGQVQERLSARRPTRRMPWRSVVSAVALTALTLLLALSAFESPRSAMAEISNRFRSAKSVYLKGTHYLYNEAGDVTNVPIEIYAETPHSLYATTHGSSNGELSGVGTMVCRRDRQKILWKPITGEARILPVTSVPVVVNRLMAKTFVQQNGLLDTFFAGLPEIEARRTETLSDALCEVFVWVDESEHRLWVNQENGQVVQYENWEVSGKEPAKLLTRIAVAMTDLVVPQHIEKEFKAIESTHDVIPSPSAWSRLIQSASNGDVKLETGPAIVDTPRSIGLFVRVTETNENGSSDLPSFVLDSKGVEIPHVVRVLDDGWIRLIADEPIPWGSRLKVQLKRDRFSASSDIVPLRFSQDEANSVVEEYRSAIKSALKAR